MEMAFPGSPEGIPGASVERAPKQGAVAALARAVRSRCALQANRRLACGETLVRGTSGVSRRNRRRRLFQCAHGARRCGGAAGHSLLTTQGKWWGCVMNAPPVLTIDLLSETTFGGGGTTPGEVDIEIDHDDLGLPRLSAKTLHGLFRDSWLSMQVVFSGDEYKEAAARLFGPAADFGEDTILRIGDAEVDDVTRSVVRPAVTRKDFPLCRWDILHALTSIRTQTSESRESGAPADGTLRSSRVLVRGLRLVSRLE